MAPKLGMGLYGDPDQPQGFNDANLQFARQLGCTHVTLHLPGHKLCPNENGVWQVADLVRCKEQAASHGLVLFAIENFYPQHWYKILLGLPGREEQMENLKTTIRNMGKAGIACMGYLFALTGVYGHAMVGVRGGAQSVAVLEDHVPNPRGLKQEDGQPLRRENGDLGLPLPKGEVWDMVVDAEAFATGEAQTATEEEMWERFTYFLHELVPVAEEAGVRLAAHPDDPPVPVLRGVSKLIYHPDRYQTMLDIYPSHYNSCEFCQGTVSEMLDGGDFVYDAIRRYAGKNISYVHFRNVVGKAPNYREVFIDEGDVDMMKAMEAYRDAGFEGVMIPDHTPSTSSPAPWHAGIAFAIGYMKASAKAAGIEFEKAMGDGEYAATTSRL